jgi:hypothetical protein
MKCNHKSIFLLGNAPFEDSRGTHSNGEDYEESTTLPLPSFFEVQWSSLRVCDPLLTYRQPSPKEPEDKTTCESVYPPMKNLALLSPPMLEVGLHPDLLLENGCEVSSSRVPPTNLFADSEVTHSPGNEVCSELWQM